MASALLSTLLVASSSALLSVRQALALWVIGKGFIPEGVPVKALVNRIRLAYEDLPRRPYSCAVTRTNNGVCYTPGKNVEAAYEACLKEIRQASLITLGDIRTVKFQAF